MTRKIVLAGVVAMFCIGRRGLARGQVKLCGDAKCVF